MDESTRRFVGVLADLTVTERIRYRLAMSILDGAMALHRGIMPDRVLEAADTDDSLQHTLGFERRGSPDGNVYVFKMPDGRVVELDPNATVSHLQNRI